MRSSDSRTVLNLSPLLDFACTTFNDRVKFLCITLDDFFSMTFILRIVKTSQESKLHLKASAEQDVLRLSPPPAHHSQSCTYSSINFFLVNVLTVHQTAYPQKQNLKNCQAESPSLTVNSFEKMMPGQSQLLQLSRPCVPLPSARRRMGSLLQDLLVVFVIVVLVALQLEAAPDSGALDLVGVPQRVRHGVDRCLYGSVDEHGRGGCFSWKDKDREERGTQARERQFQPRQ